MAGPRVYEVNRNVELEENPEHGQQPEHTAIDILAHEPMQPPVVVQDISEDDDPTLNPDLREERSDHESLPADAPVADEPTRSLPVQSVDVIQQHEGQAGCFESCCCCLCVSPENWKGAHPLFFVLVTLLVISSNGFLAGMVAALGSGLPVWVWMRVFYFRKQANGGHPHDLGVHIFYEMFWFGVISMFVVFLAVLLAVALFFLSTFLVHDLLSYFGTEGLGSMSEILSSTGFSVAIWLWYFLAVAIAQEMGKYYVVRRLRMLTVTSNKTCTACWNRQVTDPRSLVLASYAVSLGFAWIESLFILSSAAQASLVTALLLAIAMALLYFPMHLCCTAYTALQVIRKAYVVEKKLSFFRCTRWAIAFHAAFNLGRFSKPLSGHRIGSELACHRCLPGNAVACSPIAR